MRIVGGALSGRRFAGPPGSSTRPTSERVREAIASALDARDAIHDARVLDLFAGTGALAFEALSRGARSAVLVELDRKVKSAIDESARTLGLRDRIQTIGVDLLRDPVRAAEKLEALATEPFTLVFVDPPYAEILRVPPLLAELVRRGTLADDAFVVLEHAVRIPPGDLTPLEVETTYRHGDTQTVLARPRRARDDAPTV